MREPSQQEVVSRKRLVNLKIDGKANPADVLTKSMSRVLAESLLRPVGVVYVLAESLLRPVGVVFEKSTK